MQNNNWGGYRKGSGRPPLDEKDKKKGTKIYVNYYLKEDILEYGRGNTFSEKAVDLITSEISNRKKLKSN